MAQLALKIDVDTYRGTRIGVPALVELLQRYQANATFLFSLGPDHTGRAIKRVFRPGFLNKVSRTSVLEHYGLKTLLYGTVLPGPDIGKRCAPILRQVRDAGFEVGIHTWDHIRWQDGVMQASNEWVAEQMQRAVTRFNQIFAAAPLTHGAAGWQMNRHAFRLTQQHGFHYASDTRGTHPFIPVLDAEIIACPQLPTTLPTLDELLGLNGLTTANVHEHLLALTQEPPPHGHVYTLHAELEGMKLLPVFERLLAGWQAQGYSLVSAHQLRESLDDRTLPHHKVEFRAMPGRSGVMATQGAQFMGC